MFARFKRFYFARFRFILILVFGLILAVLLTKTYLVLSRLVRDTGISPGIALGILSGKDTALKNQDERTNILILGIGGQNHEGNDLTDTMIVLSVNQKNRSLAMVSLPRDIWSDTLKDKINSAYHYGEETENGGGLSLAKTIVGETTGLTIHYAVLVDFNGFKKIIDEAGGVEVNVPEGFTDNEFPLAGRESDPCGGDPLLRCRYETVKFTAGRQFMDGVTALKYVRSRHATGDEGNDFARNRRQLDVILALKQKLENPVFWLNPHRDRQVIAAIDASLATDMKLAELLTAGKIFSGIGDNQIKKIALESHLTEPGDGSESRYMLVPKESWEQIHTFIKSELGLTR